MLNSPCMLLNRLSHLSMPFARWCLRAHMPIPVMRMGLFSFCACFFFARRRWFSFAARASSIRLPGEIHQVSSVAAHDVALSYGSMQQLFLWLGIFEVASLLIARATRAGNLFPVHLLRRHLSRPSLAQRQNFLQLSLLFFLHPSHAVPAVCSV